MTLPARKKARVDSGSSGASADAASALQSTAMERRLKKRESDRKCQRISRERTKSRIAQLEKLVEELSQADDSGKVAALLETVSQLQQERDNLANKLKSIESILFPGEPPTKVKVPKVEGSPSSNLNLSSLAAEPEHDAEVVSTATEVPEGSAQGISGPVVNPKHITGTAEDSQRMVLQERSLRNDQYMPLLAPIGGFVCECSYARSLQKQTLNFWYQGNMTLGAWMKWPKLVPAVSDDDPFHDDTPVRAIIEGWDAVEQRGHVHPMWRLLRTMDEGLFSHAETATSRLGILGNVSRVLRAHLDTTHKQLKQLPTYWPSRVTAEHCAYATNFVAWPGVRQALDRDEHRFCSNHFWTVFINSMRVEWPYEFRDCYLLNSATGLYKLSPLFDETIKDIRKIGVCKSFFQHYPELEGAVNVIYENPSHVECVTAARCAQVDVNGLDLGLKVAKARGPSTGIVATGQKPSTALASGLFDQQASWDLLDAIPELSLIPNRDFV
ncbi:hypothetical protein PV08_11100 [Exophiala spinifera]|uniref:BZIP domain-containing protein n=1 Tax=Exophiala spinifera TaxID=91928 RepID=A0A0D2BFK2_9EURO|nr:uncharacterized protein PV08_11100 [Exophiala spinifera]KIW10139.1 hypothetical protein PV08_11100 [Exophiala spinifera]